MRYFSKTLHVLLALGLSGFFAKDCFAYEVSANSIYLHAKRNDINYLRLIKRYRNAINVVDYNGDSAYCIALKNNDKNTLEILKQWGANSNHECVKNVRNYSERKSKVVRINNDTAKRTIRYTNAGGSNYALWGLSAIGVAGGVAALSGGGGSGGKSSSAENNTGGGNNNGGGNNGNVGGDDNNVIKPTISYKEFHQPLFFRLFFQELLLLNVYLLQLILFLYQN